MQNLITKVKDYPTKGDTGYDLLPILSNPLGLKGLIDRLCSIINLIGIDIDKVVGIEPGGLMLGPVLAYQIGAGFIPITQDSVSASDPTMFYKTMGYKIPMIGIEKYEHVLLVDDVIRTGSTMELACQLVGNFDAQIVGCMAIINVVSAGGADRIKSKGSVVYTITEF